MTELLKWVNSMVEQLIAENDYLLHRIQNYMDYKVVKTMENDKDTYGMGGHGLTEEGKVVLLVISVGLALTFQFIY